jgi:hypothetical protein
VRDRRRGAASCMSSICIIVSTFNGYSVVVCLCTADGGVKQAVGMKTDEKISLPFPYSHFIVGNRIGSGIVGNGNGSGINGIAKTNGNRNTNETYNSIQIEMLLIFD